MFSNTEVIVPQTVMTQYIDRCLIITVSTTNLPKLTNLSKS